MSSREHQHWIKGIRVPDNRHDDRPNFWPEIVYGYLGIWSDTDVDGTLLTNGPRCVLNHYEVTPEVWFYAVRGMGLEIRSEPIPKAQT